MAEALPPADVPVLVCGARFAGAAATRALLHRGHRVLLSDQADSELAQALVGEGAEWIGAPDSVPAEAGLVVTSPGFRPDHPLLVDAHARGLEVLGEVEFAWRLRPIRPAGAAPWLLVTGTNGKTTTVRMAEAMLQAAGRRAVAVGNVGVSVIDAVTADYDVLAVEVSSFQLYWSATIEPAAGVLLNLAPDHLDWHGSMAAYAAAKVRVWTGDVALGNADDPAVTALLASAPAARRFEFTLGEPTAGQLGVRGGLLVDRAFGGGELLPAAEVQPAGAHNVANALAAAGLVRAIGVEAEAVAAGLRAFVPDPHRNQFVLEHGGVRYVDDSKATNPHAARAALSGYEQVVWIAGGQLKDAPVDDLIAEMAPRLRGAVLLGQDRALIADALRRHAPDVPVITVSSTDDGAMTEVVRAAAGLARAGDVVLLSPAGASYDMFSGYPARGRAFAAAVEELGR